jgi:hypothetical protein
MSENLSGEVDGVTVKISIALKFEKLNFIGGQNIMVGLHAIMNDWYPIAALPAGLTSSEGATPG